MSASPGISPRDSHNSITDRVSQFVFAFLKNEDVVKPFLTDTNHGHIIEFPGGGTALLVTDEGLRYRGKHYLDSEHIDYVQRVRIGRGKGGDAKSGRPRLIMMVDHRTAEAPFWRAVADAYRWEDEHLEKERS